MTPNGQMAGDNGDDAAGGHSKQLPPPMKQWPRRAKSGKGIYGQPPELLALM
jgi:hypothetical protein